jgi:hypothetical protein
MAAHSFVVQQRPWRGAMALAGLLVLTACVPGVSPVAEPTDWLADLSTAPAASGPTGTLTLRVHAARKDLANLSGVTLFPEWGGAGSGPDRRRGWHRVPAFGEPTTEPDRGDTPARALVLDEQPALAGRGPLPASHYDRVIVASPRVEATLPDGRRIRLTSHIEPIHRGFELSPGDHVTIDLALIVLPVPGGGPHDFEIFVKDAVLAAANLWETQ